MERVYGAIGTQTFHCENEVDSTRRDKMNLIQDTWNEPDDQDLHQHLSDCKVVLTKEEILHYDWSKVKCVYADTSVIQSKLKGPVVDTYPDELTCFYGRRIEKVDKSMIPELKNKFVKPIKNSKAFEASIIKTRQDIEQLVEEMRDYSENEVYVSDLVDFVNEWRIFFREGTWDMIDSSDFLISSHKIVRQEPAKEFLELLLSQRLFKEKPYNICVVDVGMLKSGEWVVVEVNPAFSLTSYGWDIAKYCAYCEAAWKNLSKIKIQL